MTRPRTALFALIAAVVVLCTAALVWRAHSRTRLPASSAATEDSRHSQGPSNADDLVPTEIYAHNLILRKGPIFRVYVRWLRGQMVRTRTQVNPSLDDPESFFLQIDKGVMRANIGDIGNYLNANSPPNAPLRNISIQPDGDLLKLHGTLHKVVPLPIELFGNLLPMPDGRVKFRVAKLSMLKIPLKGLLGGLHVQISDLIHNSNMAGIQIAGNDIIFDTQGLLPPPHIHGQITSLRVSRPDIEVIYGNAPNDEAELAKWHNFLRLNGGALDFGKLTMHNVDLTMIDASQDQWFDLDLVNYQSQLVNGYTRMTPQAGLEIFMPDLDARAPTKAIQKIPLEWLKDRNRSLPPEIPIK